ncbi:hypothetical protein [Pseudomonas sp. BN102]|uniref:hypothetical protein n=1 Tax=Pseudomonas sp. BN102 TaxID=2567886 RepID=UPI0024573504|nr:hypothetical protein [Pseudomonas sp. BN102]MDH4609737.1 hypothetical protein [Pseudomonas sp. BN102]
MPTENQTLKAYQVGECDIVAAYSPEGAFKVFCEYCSYQDDEFDLEDVDLVSDQIFDNLQAYRGPDREAIAANVEAARRLALYACTLGWFPLCPHMNSAHMDADLPDLGDAFWLRGTMELMERCNAVVLRAGTAQPAPWPR